MSFTQQIAAQVIPPLATACALAITTGAGAGLKWLLDHVKDARLNAAVKRIGEAADKVVRDLSNTMVDAIKTASLDGKISPEDRQKIKDAAVDNLKKYLGAIGMKDLAVQGKKTPDEVKVALSTEVESAVWRMKLQQSAAAAAPPSLPSVALPPTV